MVILGAGGHAKEILEIVLERYSPDQISFFDNVTPNDEIPKLFFEFNLIRDLNTLIALFKNDDKSFVIGVGGVRAKQILWELATNAGGIPLTLMANNASIGHYETEIGIGSTIMQMVLLSNSVSIGQGVLINSRANIHHDITIGDFCEIGPNALLLGRAKIGKNVFIGAGAVILPNVVIGDNCTIGAGAVVTKNLMENLIVKGNPAR